MSRWTKYSCAEKNLQQPLPQLAPGAVLDLTLIDFCFSSQIKSLQQFVPTASEPQPKSTSNVEQDSFQNPLPHQAPYQCIYKATAAYNVIFKQVCVTIGN